jgi:hypothetical protein
LELELEPIKKMRDRKEAEISEYNSNEEYSSILVLLTIIG